MTTPTLPKQRNLTLDICKFVAACFVVFIHAPFPGAAGEYILCLARFAVPMFFAVSGWYSYGVSSRKILSRLCHVLLLELAGIAIVQLWTAFAAFYMGRDVLRALCPALPSGRDWMTWLVWLEDPLESHLWYLSASAFCYGVFWLYTLGPGGRKDYRGLYALGFVLLCANMAMGELSRYSGLTVSFKVPRSGLFLGLPMFSLGLFLREHRETLLSRLGMGLLPVVPVFGFLLTIVEWKCFGSHSLYLGHFFVLAGLLLLTFRYPGVPRSLEKAAVLCGPVSTVVYLVHLTLCDVYLGFFQWRLEGLLGSAEAWIRPLLVLGASIMAAWCWLALVRLCKRFRK